MPDRQFPAKQAERDEYSVAEESRITSRRVRPKASASRKRGWSVRTRIKGESYKVETWSALLAAVSQQYLKKHGEHRDKKAAMTAEKNAEELDPRPGYVRGVNKGRKIGLFSTRERTYSFM